MRCVTGLSLERDLLRDWVGVLIRTVWVLSGGDIQSSKVGLSVLCRMCVMFFYDISALNGGDGKEKSAGICCENNRGACKTVSMMMVQVGWSPGPSPIHLRTHGPPRPPFPPINIARNQSLPTVPDNR